LRSRVLTQAGQVLHRYKADAVANTAVSAIALKPYMPWFSTVRIVTRPADIVRIKSLLTSGGYYRGPLDRRFNADLRHAIEAFERAHGRPATGLATAEVLELADAAYREQTIRPEMAASGTRLETGSVAPQPKR
jgi:protease YdgD